MNKLSDLRVIGVPWHTAHQYELAKLFKSYDLLLNPFRTWGDSSRPFPANMKYVIEVDPKDYDLAILHVDQQCVHPDITKGKLYREFKEITKDIPQVVINHMTPFDDRLETPEVVARMRELVGKTPMITNSREAAEQWGWGFPIIHGLNIDEWPDNPKEPRAVASLSTGGMGTAYRRELLHATMEIVRDRGFNFIWIQADKKFTTFEDYKDYLSRSQVYVNLTWQSPMPRSRTEAMLCGCAVVSTRHQDWGSYITEGENGYLVPDNPQAAADVICRLLSTGYKESIEVGKRGREFARKTFTHERWANDWEKLLRQLKILE